MSHRLPVFPVRALTLTWLLIGGLASPALAHSDGALRPSLDATTPARPANGPATERSSAGSAPAATPTATSTMAAAQPDRLALVSEGASRSVDLPVVVPVALTTAAVAEAGYVDPAGGHPRVRPIETRNPYRGRQARR